MTNANRQSAVAALNSVRPIGERLNRSREGEDRAADILELWDGTETALRALMGGSSLGGQALIRELRQKELITLGQAYALLEFLGARDRANRTTYKSTPGDVDAAREGYRQLDIGLQQADAGVPAAGGPAPTTAVAAAAVGQTTSPYSQGARPVAPAAPPVTPPGVSAPEPAAASSSRSLDLSRLPSRRGWLIGGVAALALVAALAFGLSNRGGGADLDQGIEMMRSGRREAARGEFARVARDNPTLAAPHVFLSRLAREEGDLATARRELETAIRAEPTNYTALREMGLVLLANGDYELARKFFVRALQANPSDLSSQGYLGCALARLGRSAEAEKFLSRAGPGSWRSCSVPAPAFDPQPLRP